MCDRSSWRTFRTPFFNEEDEDEAEVEADFRLTRLIVLMFLFLFLLLLLLLLAKNERTPPNLISPANDNL